MRKIINIIFANPLVIQQRIADYYLNAHTYKYQHAYDKDDIKRDFWLAYNDMNLIYGNSTKQEWLDNGYDVATNKRGWAFAFKTEGKDTIIIYDVDNCDNLPLLYQNRNQVYHKPNNVINMP